MKVLLLEEENLELRNQIIENHITIFKMQNISNWNLKEKIEKINKDCKVIILTPTYPFDNQKAGNTVIQLWFRYRIYLIFSSPLSYI